MCLTTALHTILSCSLLSLLPFILTKNAPHCHAYPHSQLLTYTDNMSHHHILIFNVLAQFLIWLSQPIHFLLQHAMTSIRVHTMPPHTYHNHVSVLIVQSIPYAIQSSTLHITLMYIMREVPQHMFCTGDPQEVKQLTIYKTWLYSLGPDFCCNLRNFFNSSWDITFKQLHYLYSKANSYSRGVEWGVGAGGGVRWLKGA